MKKILITGGPTVEPIDEVMKITNFSTGSLSVTLTDMFLENGDMVCLIANGVVNTEKLENKQKDMKDSLKIVTVETTQEMMDAMEAESKKDVYDVVIHAAAVGDYKSDFVFLMEHMAEELFEASKEGFSSEQDILRILENPKCRLDDSSKISSYQKNLTVKLCLTPKIIGKLRNWFPATVLIGCKLLENVSKEELYEVAQKLCIKNDMDYIMANDLLELRSGKPARYLVNKEGFTGKQLETPQNIFEFVREI